jgi:hypothetical protein
VVWVFLFAIVIVVTVLRNVEKGERGRGVGVGIHATGLGLRGLRETDGAIQYEDGGGKCTDLEKTLTNVSNGSE